MRKSMILIAVSALVLCSCGSKKELVACQETNKSLNESLQAAKEDLAAKNARITSLENDIMMSIAAKVSTLFFSMCCASSDSRNLPSSKACAGV